ncbi:unnamed protein product [Urochloa humidicola]
MLHWMMVIKKMVPKKMLLKKMLRKTLLMDLGKYCTMPRKTATMKKKVKRRYNKCNRISKLTCICKVGLKKLGTTLDFLQWKAANGVTNKGFGQLLKLVKKILPEGDELSSSTYEAKQLVCPIGLEVQNIHTCPNDCILYHGTEYENLDCCSVCSCARYKTRQYEPIEAVDENSKKKIPTKVIWYFPLIPHLKRLFRNKEHAKLM